MSSNSKATVSTKTTKKSAATASTTVASLDELKQLAEAAKADTAPTLKVAVENATATTKAMQELADATLPAYEALLTARATAQNAMVKANPSFRETLAKEEGRFTALFAKAPGLEQMLQDKINAREAEARIQAKIQKIKAMGAETFGDQFEGASNARLNWYIHNCARAGAVKEVPEDEAQTLKAGGRAKHLFERRFGQDMSYDGPLPDFVQKSVRLARDGKSTIVTKGDKTFINGTAFFVPAGDDPRPGIVALGIARRALNSLLDNKRKGADKK